MTNLWVIRNITKSPKVFSRIFFLSLFLVIFFLSSCARIEAPQIISFKIEKVDIKNKNPLNLLFDTEAIKFNLAVEVTNQNDSEIEFTVKNLSINFDSEPIGHLVKPETYTLVPEAVSEVKIRIALNPMMALGALILAQMKEKTTIEVLGDVLFHHSTGDYPVQVAEQYEVDLSKIYSEN